MEKAFFISGSKKTIVENNDVKVKIIHEERIHVMSKMIFVYYLIGLK